jgi:hypothetical protein
VNKLKYIDSVVYTNDKQTIYDLLNIGDDFYVDDHLKNIHEKKIKLVITIIF